MLFLLLGLNFILEGYTLLWQKDSAILRTSRIASSLAPSIRGASFLDYSFWPLGIFYIFFSSFWISSVLLWLLLFTCQQWMLQVCIFFNFSGFFLDFFILLWWRWHSTGFLFHLRNHCCSGDGKVRNYPC